jgi:penicillin amidase
VIATGQSGNPLSPHYGDMVERWRDGRHVTIATDKETARQRAVSTLTLMPK